MGTSMEAMVEARPSRFLDLPGEIRMMIYRALLVRNRPIEIKRSTARLWCDVDQKWWQVDFENTRRTALQHSDHPDCEAKLTVLFSTDLRTTIEGQIHAAHFPCAKLLDRAGNGLDLALLGACKQIYAEARHIPFSENVFLTVDLSAFSNFLYCLKAWQVQSIRHLDFQIPEALGMTKFLAEWNDVFSLIAASCQSLHTVSVQVQLFDPPYACRSSFWDAGLLELDRLSLKAMKFIILDMNAEPYFTYTAGKGPSSPTSVLRSVHFFSSHTIQNTTQPIRPLKLVGPESEAFFHDCRDRLRDAYEYDTNNQADCGVFFRFSPNPCPLYVRNLIYLIPRRKRSHADIQREDRLQREYSSYQYAYQVNEHDPGKVDRVVGYQFSGGAAGPEDDEIAKNVEKVRLARTRLALKLQSGAVDLIRPPARQKHSEISRDPRRSRPSPWEGTMIDTSPPGYWRRRFNEEAFAPFLESFPPQRVVVKTERGQNWKCHECATSAADIKCFVSH